MEKSGKIFFAAAYLIMATAMFYLPAQGFFVGSFGVEYKYLLGLGIVALSLLHFLISADLRSAVRCSRDALVMARPYLWTLAYSLVFWVVTMAEFRVMTKGTFLIAYQLIAFMAAAGTLYMFGSKGIYYMMAALTAALGILSVQQMLQAGPATFLQEYFRNILTFTAESGVTMRAFEKLGHCYATGFCLVYFLLTIRERKANIFWAAVSLLLFFLGLKRSVFFGVSGALVLGLLITRLRNPKKWIIPVTVVGTLAVFGYIFWVHKGLFNWLESIGITTSGRSWLYGQIRDYYELSPVYFGKGAGFVATAFSNGTFDVSEFGFVIGDIHNEYLRQYIECGFWGFLVWMWLYTANRIKYFFGKGASLVEKRRGALTFALVIVNCIMFMTENSQYYFYTTLVMSVLIMGYHHEEFAEKTRLPGD